MKLLYMECGMGVAGDMLMAALMGNLNDKSAFLDKLNSLGIPGVEVRYEKAVTHGIEGGRIFVEINGHTEESHHHHHPSYIDVRSLISQLPLDDKVKSDALAVYYSIAEAEAAVHGTSVEQVHFHEVGALDAVADVVGCCMLIHELNVDRIYASSLRVGSGTVRCAHGVLPVPAPATANLLRGIPIFGGEIKGEMCTPTGAALVAHFASEYKDLPQMITESVGYGIGGRDFGVASCVRTFVGKSSSAADVTEICCNLDDMTPEAIGYAMEVLFKEGALDVYTIPIGMKKNRSGVLFTCLCDSNDEEKFSELILRHTTTIGVRQKQYRRRILDRELRTVNTSLGNVRVKYCPSYGKMKPEYDDIVRIAHEKNMTFETVKSTISNEI